jgi:hypothetical protein
MYSLAAESATMRTVAWGLVPFLCLIYVVAFIDRINIGFAALTMSKDLGLTPAMFGFELLISETLAWSGDGRLHGGHSGRQFIAGPLSGVLLQMNGIAGFKGWQWMFIVEGVPSVILGLVVLKFLTDAPDKATWLKPEQRDWLVKEMAAEAGSPEHHSLKEVLGTLISWKVMRLALVYFGLTTGFHR